MVAKDYPKFKRNIKDVNYLENLDTYLSFGTSRAIRNQERWVVHLVWKKLIRLPCQEGEKQGIRTVPI